MSLVILSDIHSNYRFLKKIINEIDLLKVEDIYCLGDIIGYYDQPAECIDLLIERGVKCIKGNHEKYLLGEAHYNSKNESLYGFFKQKRELKDKQVEFLSLLPDQRIETIRNNRFIFIHSLPQNTTKYIFNPYKFDKTLLNKYDFYCSGHTHIPYILYINRTCVLNPGSVGQPRDYTKKPSFILIDLTKQSIILKKAKLDYASYIKKLQKMNYSIKLMDILKR